MKIAVIKRNNQPWFSARTNEDPLSYKPLFSLSPTQEALMIFHGFGEIKSTISGFKAEREEKQKPEREGFLSAQQNPKKSDEWIISMDIGRTVGVEGTTHNPHRGRFRAPTW